MRARSATCVVLTLATVATLAAPPAAIRAATDPASARARLSRDSVVAVGMLDRGQTDSALVYGRAAAAAARGSGDAALDARAELFVPGLLIRLARANDALPGILAGKRLAEASRDTFVWMMSMRMESMARNYRGEYPQGERLARRWNELAIASGNLEYQGWAATMFGWLAYHRGDLVTARRELERSAVIFEKVGHPVGLPYTLNTLAGVVSAQGDYRRARELYERVLSLGQASGNSRLQVMALENLGMIESRVGDPALSVARWREALAIHAARHETADWLVDADNLIEEWLALGRADDARAMAEQALVMAERESLGMELPWQHASLAQALWAQGHAEAAKREWRLVVAGAPTGELQAPASAASDWIAALIEQDSTAAALALATDACARLAPGADQQTRARLVTQRARLLIDTGRAREALALARPLAAELEKAGDLELALAAWTEVVRARRRVGPADSVTRAIERATAVWESGRTHASDPEFRELRGEQAHRLMLESVAHALAAAPGGADGRAAQAFDQMQRFKTRTLLERVAGPGVFADSPPSWLGPPLVDLTRLRHEVLAPDELLIEFASGPDTTWLFAVTREECRVLRAPGERALKPALTLLNETCAAPARRPSDPAFAGLAATRVGALLLGGLDDLLATHSALVVAPDGALQRVPFVVLVSPDGHEALGVRHRVSVTPSASLLALLRGRGDRGGQRMLAIAGAPAPGHAPLAGARREVGELATRYQGVDAWVASARGHASLEPGRLADYRAFHFAGHAHVDDQLPWRSGLLIGADARGEDSLLTADRIAASRLKASLVVLSSCESGRGRARAGEGVSGLASAFLAAGGSAVVASLWPVEDRATERLMTSFYDGLARGLAADRALADAQASVRADPASAAPFYWAGFVLIGDGRTTLPLARRWLPFPPAVLALCLLAILAVVAGLIGWTRSRTSGGSGDDPRP